MIYIKKTNKILIIIIIFLIPLTIISFFNKETNFSNPKPQTNKKNKEIKYVKVKKNNQIITIDLNTYLIGVIAGEMPASFEPEALKAQAIASRTYLFHHQNTSDVIDSTIAAQVYLSKEEMQEKWQTNYDKYYNKIAQSVTDTKNMILTYKGKPIKAYYYSMSNGYSESSLNVFNEQNDYLNIVESSWDKDNENTTYLSKEQFCNKLEINCSNITINNIIKDDSKRVAQININNKNFTGVEVRKKLNLRSTDFTITLEQDQVKIVTHGYGHGVGMSQYGANNMAKEGYEYKDILKHYYENTEISNI